MLDEAQYASDTDESDEDYNPGVDGSDVASEVESDGEPENDDEKDAKSKRGQNKRPAAELTPVATKRTRQSEDVVSSSTTEKDELVDDDDDENEEALWASFLSKSGQATAKPATTQSKPSQPSKTVASNGSSSKAEKEREKPKVETPSSSTEKTKIVTEIFEFAGEKVEVKKKVKVTDEKPAASNEADPKKTTAKPGPNLPFNRPRSSGGSGLSSVLGQIGKTNKLSILEKTKLDWGGFKQSEGIDEEIQTFNKGRDGYLERQDFLQRTDLRQFEIEKNLRAANRKKL
ncbi:craniofacial development protein 1 [Sitodiplosis mosellana]|uniref:craniofacial development protein 1 n=1 Tax=Sitodiplosis mosellana TaxID=263140 RepID=UPI002444015E|nr:craniofacial development protein 1 [Sitodiplosis mosellana]